MNALSGTINWEILDKSANQELFLELKVDGQHSGLASIDSSELSAILSTLNVSGETVKNVLADELKNSLAKPTISSVELVMQDTKDPHLYHGLCVTQLGKSIKGMLIWYNISNSETGPEETSAVARNLLRHKVNVILKQQRS